MPNEQIPSSIVKQIDMRATELGGRIRTTAQTLHTIAEHLRADANTSAAAGLAERGSALIDNVGTYFENSDFDTFVADAETFSRERPWTIASVGLAAGIVAARILKAAASRRHALTESSFPTAPSPQTLSYDIGSATSTSGARLQPARRRNSKEVSYDGS